MKKKLFLVIAIVAVLACLFAIGVSAAEPNYDGEKVTLADGTVCPLYDLDGNPLVWIVTSTAEDGTRTYAHVSAAFFDTANPPSTRVDFISTGGSAYEFNNLTVTLNGVEYAKSAVVVLNMRDAKITSVGKGREGNAATFPYRTMENCTNLEYLYLHTGTTSIGQTSFNGCNNLKYVNFDELTELKDIGQQAFNGCSKLYEGKVLDFRNTKLVSTATNSLRAIAATEAIFPATFTSFGQETFRECPNITKITFLGELTSIGTHYSFLNCSNLETIIAPGKGFSILSGIFGSQAFKGCAKIKQVDGLIENGVVTLPAAITQIYGEAFRDCTSITKFVIPEDSQLYDIGASTFQNCTALQSINLVDGIYSIGNDCFRNSGLTYVKLPRGLANDNRVLGYNTFQDCKYLTTIDFSNCPMKTFSVAFALNCDGLRYLSLPEGVKELSSNCFDGCDNLEAVYLPDSLETLGMSGWNNGSFANCPKLYFVNEPITPVANYDDFEMPEKPEVYFMPTSLKSQFDPSTQGVVQCAGPFVKCKNLNKYLVFPEGFTNFYTYDNWFKFAGSKENPINIVCLGDMTDVVYNSASWDRSCYISYYFMNKNDQSLEDVKITNTATSAKTDGAYVYFCQSGTKYQIVGNTNTLSPVELAEGESLHIHNPRANKFCEATCTDAAGDYQYCFCGEVLEFVQKGSDALGHLYNDLRDQFYPENNYYANATCVYFCSQCSGDVTVEDAEGTKLFTAYGYSASEDDPSNVAFIVYANAENIKAYSEFKTISVAYGLVVSANTNGTPLTYADGSLTESSNTVKINMTGTDYNKLTVRVSNIGSFALHCNGYILVGEELFYLNHATVDTTAQTITYAEMLELLDEDESETEEEIPEETPAE
ncbi:MAG: leucine-rich repeat domain-containing protein [Ruminococcaceae bacterium]|nr:leucine-rich repeat domain-containing protein [Oscillospiraceae bacterium]